MSVIRNRVPSAVAGYFSTTMERSTCTYSTVTVWDADDLDSTPRTVYWAVGFSSRALFPMVKVALASIFSPAFRLFLGSVTLV